MFRDAASLRTRERRSGLIDFKGTALRTGDFIVGCAMVYRLPDLVPSAGRDDDKREVIVAYSTLTRWVMNLSFPL